MDLVAGRHLSLGTQHLQQSRKVCLVCVCTKNFLVHLLCTLTFVPRLQPILCVPMTAVDCERVLLLSRLLAHGCDLVNSHQALTRQLLRYLLKHVG